MQVARSTAAARIVVLFAATLALCAVSVAQAEAKKDFKLAWSIYVGWMPWDYGAASGILDKWAERYGITIELVQVNDYVESINQYTAGQFDGVTATNMDTLTIPAASGVDTTALIVGDFSNGNDGIVLRDKKRLRQVKGQTVNLVELSVSHYLLARALDSVGMSERDVTVVNTSDADIVGAWASGGINAVVTWNPLLSEITGSARSNLVFDSSATPGEIIDLTVVNTQTLADNPAFGKALVGAWYEIMLSMHGGPAKVSALTHMAEASGTDLAGYNAQLSSTRMFYDASDALEFVTSKAPRTTMQSVAEFSFNHGLLGEGAPNAEFIGVAFPDGSIWGNRSNVKMRFDATYMRMAADGEL